LALVLAPDLALVLAPDLALGMAVGQQVTEVVDHHQRHVHAEARQQVPPGDGRDGLRRPVRLERELVSEGGGATH
jgi:hypothetical protein